MQHNAPNILAPLLAVALRGTGKHTLSLEDLPDFIQLALPPSEDATTTLLNAIALTTIAQNAGYRTVPQPDFVLPDPVVDTRSFCNPLAVRLWRQIVELESKYPIFEARWLQLCAQRGQVLAPELIVPILEMASHKKMTHARPLIQKVLGERGLWVARMNDKWRYAVPKPSPQVWREGKPAERLTLLRHLRSAQPMEGITLLAAGWEKESASDRRLFLDVLRIGLSVDDIPFLTQQLTALQQQTTATKPIVQEIKHLMVHLLVQIESSDLRQQWIALLRPYFVKKHFVLPTTDDDGCFNPIWLCQFCGFSTQKEIVGWWIDLLRFMPPSIWTMASGLSPEATVDILAKSPYPGGVSPSMVIDSLIKATLSTQDTVFASVLLQKGTNEQFLLLMELLPHAQREAVMMDKKQSAGVLHLLWSTPAVQFEWSEGFSHWVLTELYQSWIGFYFNKVQQIMPLDVFFHPNIRPADIPQLNDSSEKRDRWLQMIAPELEKTLSVKRSLYRVTTHI